MKSRIPEEDEARRALAREFGRVGREAASRQHRRRSRSRAPRAVVVAVLLLLLLAAATVAGTTLLDDGQDLRPERSLPSSVAPAPDDARLSPVRVADPVGDLPWGVRLYTNALGKPCIVVGRVKDGQLGVLRDRQFSRRPPGTPGACVSGPDQHFAFALQRYPFPDQGRSVLYGVADRTVSAVTLVLPGGETQHLPIADDGAVLDVRRGAQAYRGVTLRWLAQGRPRTMPLG